MISNERQYRITKAQANRLREALARLTNGTDGARSEALDPLIAAAERDALGSQIDELEAQLDGYEQLRATGSVHIEPSMLDTVAEDLIKQRIAKGLGQRQLAELLGLKEQQIQRYESTRYEGASLKRLQEISHVLHAAPGASERTLPAASIFRALEASGLKKDFVLDRLIPDAIARRLRGRRMVAVEDVRYVADAISRVFGWDGSPLLEGRGPKIPKGSLMLAKFKVPKSANETQVTILAAYAHYLAAILLSGIAVQPKVEFPRNWEDVRKGILKHGEVNLRSAAEYVWSLGIPILPLSRGGAFHGACLQIEDRTVIVLNRKSQVESYWLFVLLHELGHRVSSHSSTESIIEEETGTTADGAEEAAAGEFAGNVVLAGRARELGTLVTEAARGRVEYLKRAIPEVAREQGISVGALANFVAFDLSRRRVANWWGTAVGLQENGEPPFPTLREMLLERVDLSRLGEHDRGLLLGGLKEE